jgi:Nucleotidyl transferase AbiEii toxin, Type IV TA system
LNYGSVLDRLATFLESQQIPFAVIGGLAMNAYGSSRLTADVDLIVPYVAQTVIVNELRRLGYETLYLSEGYSNHVHEDSQMGRVDFVYINEHTADLILSTTRLLEVMGRSLPIPRPEYVIALKLQAIHNDPDRTHRDLADVKELMTLPDLDHEEVKDYFRRFDLLRYYDDFKR